MSLIDGSAPAASSRDVASTMARRVRRRCATRPGWAGSPGWADWAGWADWPGWAAISAIEAFPEVDVTILRFSLYTYAFDAPCAITA